MTIKPSFSLKQTWMAIVLFAVIVPVTIVTIWGGRQVYHNQLDSALAIERQADDLLRSQIESEVERFKTLLINKSDPLSFLVGRANDPKALRAMNTLLELIIEREHGIREVLIASTQADVIAAVDPGFGASDERLLSAEELQSLALHWGLDGRYEYPEIAIPSLGRLYVSPPGAHEDSVSFTISTPIGSPAKAVLIARIDVDSLWQTNAAREHGTGTESTRHYVLDSRGSLLTEINRSSHKPGDLMTHLPIARAALIAAEWPSDISYTGVIGQPVFGAITPIPSLSWTLVSEVIVSEITRPIVHGLLGTAAVDLLIILVCVSGVLVLANKTLRPLQQVSGAIARVARGDYQFVLNPSGIRELDAITSAFDDMAAQRKRAEADLRRSEEHFRTVFGAGNDAMVEINGRGAVALFNPAAERMFGRRTEDVLGQSVSCLMPDSFRSQHTEDVVGFFASGKPDGVIGRTVEVPAVRANGDEFPIEISLASGGTGDGAFVLGVIRDITERKRAEEERRSLAEQMQQMQKLESLGVMAGGVGRPR